MEGMGRSGMEVGGVIIEKNGRLRAGLGRVHEQRGEGAGEVPVATAGDGGGGDLRAHPAAGDQQSGVLSHHSEVGTAEVPAEDAFPDPAPQGKYPPPHAEDIANSIKVFQKENAHPHEAHLRTHLKRQGHLMLLSEMYPPPHSATTTSENQATPGPLRTPRPRARPTSRSGRSSGGRRRPRDGGRKGGR